MKSLTFIVMMCLAFVTGSNAAVFLDADFESPNYTAGALTGQQGWYDDAGMYQTVATGYDGVTPAEGSQFVYVDDLGITFNSNAYAAIQAMDKTNNYLRLSFYSLRKGEFNHNVGMYTADGGYIFVQCAGGSYGLPWNGGATLGSYTDETWSHVILDIDCLEETCKGVGGSVDGVVASGVSAPFTGPGLPQRLRLRPYGGSNLVDYTCFDGVKLETTPSFRISPDKTSLDFTSAQPQTLTLTPDLSGLSYDVTVSSTYSWVSNVPSTFTITDSPVVVTVAVETAGLDLPTSASIDVVSSEGVRKRLGVNVRDSLIAYDGYDYAMGEIITNLNGGTGWDGAWFVRGGDGFTAENIIVDGLTYSISNVTLQTEGNAAYLIPAENLGFTYSRSLATSLAGDNKTVWISMLLQPKLTAWHTCDLFFNPNWGGDQGAFGCQWSANWRFVNGAASGVPGTLDETFFIVVRYDLDGDNDSAYMWVNPLLNSEASTATANAAQTKAMPLGDGVDWIINHNHGGTQRGAMIFDEIRIGDTWADVVPTDVPSGVQASDGTFEDKVQVTWNALSGASSYAVYRADTNDSSVATSLQSGITTNVYGDTTAVPLQIYWYWVKSDLSSEFSGSDDGYRASPGIPQAPENLLASDGIYSNKIDVTWDTSENADRYRVLRSTEDNIAFATDISGEINTNVYEDTTVVPGASYYYWAEAGSAGGWSFPSDPDRGFTMYDGPAYDGYNYPLDESVSGRDGGYGWDDSWDALGAGFTTESIIVSGLTYEAGGVTLKTEGNAAYLIPAENAGYSYRRTFMNSLAGDNKTVWISMLIQPKLTPWDTCDLFMNPNFGSDWGAFGCQWSPNFGFVNGVKSDVTAVLDETFFVVVRYNIGEGDNDTAWMWVNPALSDEAGPADANATQTKNMELGEGANWSINHNHTGTERGAIIFDEFRIGSTWDDVVPVYQVKKVTASDGAYDDKVAVTWEQRSDVEGYTVYRNTVNDSGSATDISGELTGSSYDDTSGTAGTVYFYWVKGRFSGGIQSFSTSDAGYRSVAGGPGVPQNVSASDGVVGQTYVKITWDAVSGADVYRVFRNSVNDYGNAEAISSDLAATEYNDSDVSAGVAFYYWVRAKNATGLSNYSDPDTGYIPAQLIAYYAMDELEGTNMVDSSDNDFDGIYRDGPTLGVMSADAALFNTAVNFDVSDAVINSNSPIRDMTNNFTVAMWVNPDEIAEGEARYLIASSEVGGWNLSANGYTLQFGVPGAGGIGSPNNVITNGVWTHVAVTYSHINFARMYIDGEPTMDEQRIGVPTSYVKSDTLVANGGADELFFGSLDEIRVYTGVLSDDEILELAGIPEPGMLSIIMLTALGAFVMRKR